MTTEELPLWDLGSIFPGIDSEQYRTAVAELPAAVERANQTIGDVGLRADRPGAWVVESVAALGRAADLHEELAAYTYALFSVSTGNETARKELNRVELLSLPLREAQVAFRNALATVADHLPTLVAEREEVAAIEFYLREQLELQRHQMSPTEEQLAADLSRSGGDAWSRMQAALSSNLSALWDAERGERKTVVELRNLAFSPDRDVRKRAFECELSAWQSMELPFSFALNGVKGSAATLDARRAYISAIEHAVLQARISKRTLDSLIGVLTEALPLFRRYLKAKARALSLSRLAFYDLFAPVGSAARRWTFGEARAFIVARFSAFSEELGAFAARAFDRGWIDARPREGKVGGAYCMPFPRAGESRILANFAGDFGSLTTLAHELGHAYHHQVLKDTSAPDRQYPMTLAETASIFSETIVYDSALEVVPASERISILEDFLQGATQVTVDILSRFLFERRVFERRADGELSPREFCELMTEAQRETYGDALDPEALHPYMWAVKGHYYSQDLGFYNFPYAFGLLFGLGLAAQARAEGAPFEARYRALLASTGRASAVELTRRIGFDIETPAFWREGISMIRPRVEQFERFAEGADRP